MFSSLDGTSIMRLNLCCTAVPRLLIFSFSSVDGGSCVRLKLCCTQARNQAGALGAIVPPIAPTNCHQLHQTWSYSPTHRGLVLVQDLVVLGHGHAEDDGGDVFEAVYPLLPLRALAAHVKQSDEERGGGGESEMVIRSQAMAICLCMCRG